MISGLHRNILFGIDYHILILYRLFPLKGDPISNLRKRIDYIYFQY